MKNRQRQAPTFANINLLGKCNVNCFFCLGKDLENEFNKFDHTKVHFREWKNFTVFLQDCRDAKIDNIYITGQNTDALCYEYLNGLVSFLQLDGFNVGVRTNGYLAPNWLDVLCYCKRSVGYSIHSLNPDTNFKILRRNTIPDWDCIIPDSGTNVRVSIVANRYNEPEILDIIRYLSKFSNVKYIQIRRISTDHRSLVLHDDQKTFERILNKINDNFPRLEDFYLAPQYEIYGKKVCLWSTVGTSIGSFNYYTDGTINKDYFVVEGWEKKNGIYNPNKDEGSRQNDVTILDR